MDYCTCFQNVIDDIENNIEHEIDINSIINNSFYSKTHFYRVFTNLVGIPVNEYIRRRRLSIAAIKVINTDIKIIDLAICYGFESQESFTRAFSKEFGITPGRFRRNCNSVQLYEKINISEKFHQNLLQLQNFETQIVYCSKMPVTGLKQLVKPGSNKISEMWKEFMPIRNCINAKNPNQVLGLCEYAPDIKDDDEFMYMTGAQGEKSNEHDCKFNKMETKIIQPCKYVQIFHNPSLRTLQETYRLFYGAWLPNSHARLETRDTIEVYSLKEDTLHIWIPILL